MSECRAMNHRNFKHDEITAWLSTRPNERSYHDTAFWMWLASTGIAFAGVRGFVLSKGLAGRLGSLAMIGLGTIWSGSYAMCLGEINEAMCRSEESMTMKEAADAQVEVSEETENEVHE